MGARAVAIVSPFYYKLPPESVYAYFAEIARQTPIDVTLYNIPMFASPIDVPTIRRLAEEFPRVIGIKDSSGDLAFMMRMIAAVRPRPSRFLVPHGLGGGAGTHAADRLRWRRTRGGECSAGDHPPHVRPGARGRFRGRPWICNIASSTFSMRCSTISSFPMASARPRNCAAFNLGRGRQPQTEAQRAQRATLIPSLRRALAQFDKELAADESR